MYVYLSSNTKAFTGEKSLVGWKQSEISGTSQDVVGLETPGIQMV